MVLLVNIIMVLFKTNYCPVFFKQVSHKKNHDSRSFYVRGNLIILKLIDKNRIVIELCSEKHSSTKKSVLSKSEDYSSIK